MAPDHAVRGSAAQPEAGPAAVPRCPDEGLLGRRDDSKLVGAARRGGTGAGPEPQILRRVSRQRQVDLYRPRRRRGPSRKAVRLRIVVREVGELSGLRVERQLTDLGVAVIHQSHLPWRTTPGGLFLAVVRTSVEGKDLERAVGMRRRRSRGGGRRRCGGWWVRRIARCCGW